MRAGAGSLGPLTRATPFVAPAMAVTALVLGPAVLSPAVASVSLGVSAITIALMNEASALPSTSDIGSWPRPVPGKASETVSQHLRFDSKASAELRP